MCITRRNISRLSHCSYFEIIMFPFSDSLWKSLQNIPKKQTFSATLTMNGNSAINGNGHIEYNSFMCVKKRAYCQIILSALASPRYQRFHNLLMEDCASFYGIIYITQEYVFIVIIEIMTTASFETNAIMEKYTSILPLKFQQFYPFIAVQIIINCRII